MYKTCTRSVVHGTGATGLNPDRAVGYDGASSEIRTRDLCITNGSCQSGITDPTQPNAGQGNDLAADHPDQLDPPKPTFGQGNGPQSGPHSEAPAELAAADSVLPPDLSRLASIWPTLPDHIRAAIMTQAEGYASGTRSDEDAGRQAWMLLPEETRASIIESIGKAMNSMRDNEEREVRLLEESVEHEARHIEK